MEESGRGLLHSSNRQALALPTAHREEKEKKAVPRELLRPRKYLKNNLDFSTEEELLVTSS
jgi:hypothetical protein